MKWKIKNDKGFTIAELLIAIAVLSFLMAMFTIAVKSFQHYRAIETTKEIVKALNTAIQKTFIENAKFVQGNCYGWNDGACSQLTLTPVQVDDYTIQFNVYDIQVYSLLKSVGCQIQGGLPNFSVRCFGGFGKPLKFQVVNGHNFGENYVAPYSGQYFELKITDGIGNTYAVRIDQLIDGYLEESKTKLYTIANAIRKYIQTKRELELANVCDNPGTGPNDPAGGLGSWDDAMVPWVWEAVSDTTGNPLTLCSGVEDSNTDCGCSNFDTNIWSNDSDLCVLDTKNEVENFLRNINLDPTAYETDAFGNAIVIVPLADSQGNPISQCPPPRPQPNYPVVFLPKTRVGVKDNQGNWAIYVDVVNE